MISLRRVLSLDRIATQIRGLLVVAIVAGSSVTAAAVWLVLSEQDYPTAASTVPVRAATFVATLENLPRPTRAEVAASLRDDAVRLRLDGQLVTIETGFSTWNVLGYYQKFGHARRAFDLASELLVEQLKPKPDAANGAQSRN